LLFYSLTLKIEALYSSEREVDFERITRDYVVFQKTALFTTTAVRVAFPIYVIMFDLHLEVKLFTHPYNVNQVHSKE
jgi:hypothetical protein